MSNNEIKAAFGVLAAVAEAIRDLGQVPSGQLYATLMGSMSLDNFNSLLRILINQGLVKNENHLLTWTGPVKGGAK